MAAAFLISFFLAPLNLGFPRTWLYPIFFFFSHFPLSSFTGSGESLVWERERHSFALASCFFGSVDEVTYRKNSSSRLLLPGSERQKGEPAFMRINRVGKYTHFSKFQHWNFLSLKQRIIQDNWYSLIRFWFQMYFRLFNSIPCNIPLWSSDGNDLNFDPVSSSPYDLVLLRQPARGHPRDHAQFSSQSFFRFSQARAGRSLLKPISLHFVEWSLISLSLFLSLKLTAWEWRERHRK